MRMWMVNPRFTCNQHLLGEHVELHMLVGHLKRRRSIKGYIKSNAVEPLAIGQRHGQLVVEMLLRGMNHKSPIGSRELDHLDTEDIYAKVDRKEAAELLWSRCLECRKRIIAHGLCRGQKG